MRVVDCTPVTQSLYTVYGVLVVENLLVEYLVLDWIRQYDIQCVATRARRPVVVRWAPFKKWWENQSKQLHYHCHYNWLTTIATCKEDTHWKVKERVNYKRNGPSTLCSWGSIVTNYTLGYFVHIQLRTSTSTPVSTCFLCTCVGVYRTSRADQIRISARPPTTIINSQRQSSRPAPFRACQTIFWMMESKKGEFRFAGFPWCHDYKTEVPVNRIYDRESVTIILVIVEKRDVAGRNTHGVDRSNVGI